MVTKNSGFQIWTFGREGDVKGQDPDWKVLGADNNIWFCFYPVNYTSGYQTRTSKMEHFTVFQDNSIGKPSSSGSELYLCLWGSMAKWCGSTIAAETATATTLRSTNFSLIFFLTCFKCLKPCQFTFQNEIKQCFTSYIWNLCSNAQLKLQFYSFTLSCPRGLPLTRKIVRRQPE